MRQKAEHSMDPNGADPLAKTKFGDRYTTSFIHCYLPSHHSCTNMTPSLHNQAFSIFPPLLVLSPILLSVVSNCRIKHSAHRRCPHELQTPLVRNLLLSSQLQHSWSHESSRTLWRGFLSINLFSSPVLLSAFWWYMNDSLATASSSAIPSCVTPFFAVPQALLRLSPPSLIASVLVRFRGAFLGISSSNIAAIFCLLSDVFVSQQDYFRTCLHTY